MPIYEYRCNQCGKKVSQLVLSPSRGEEPQCIACGSRELTRLISTFAYHRSEADRLAELDTSRPTDDSYYKDSRNVGLWAKKRTRELGLDPEMQREVDQVVDKARDEASKLFE
jgi:putative FmdB family regulatory protein